ncbi:unnamed protein product [Cuscuta campestris]|uniref:Reverse transcriptase zinc-binding domain-containing protein n=1 Tax=Cuscuta campestris TaxID=132261 RepID=A0A484KY63_9ASTE|nr:unnamed protein product [Cuscuta campestris]
MRFGGMVKEVWIRVSIGFLGSTWQNLRRLGALVSSTFTVSILLCWVSKDADFSLPDALVSRVFKVSQSGYWGLQLLHQLFSQRDIELMLKITSDVGRKDMWFCPESVEHVFLRCPLAGVRRNLGIGGDKTLSFWAWFQRQTESCSMGELQVVAWAIWALGKSRNTAVWEHRVAMPEAVTQMINSMVTEWKDGFEVTGQDGAVIPPHIGQPGVTKCFVDAGLFPDITVSVILESGDVDIDWQK